MLKRTLLVCILIFATAVVIPAPVEAAATYTIDPTHSEVSFRIRHFASRVRGQFLDFAATIVKDDDSAASSVELTIQAASIDTNNERRDNHLRSADFFDVEKHPAITFRSTSIRESGENLFEVSGELTIRGVTREVTLPVAFVEEMEDGRGGFRAGFSTETTLDRKDFDITWNRLLDRGGTMLGDEVEVEITLSAIRQ